MIKAKIQNPPKLGLKLLDHPLNFPSDPQYVLIFFSSF